VGELLAFRAATYHCLDRRRDALFELIDAASCGGAVDSLPHLSLVPLHQRRHGSVYPALRKGTMDGEHLSITLVRDPPPASRHMARRWPPLAPVPSGDLRHRWFLLLNG